MRLRSERPEPGTQMIRVTGDIEGEDALSLASVPSQTDPAPRRRVVDLSEVTFIDSAGIEALLKVAAATTAAGGEIVLVLRDDSYIRRLLEIRGVIDRFHVVVS